MRPLLDQEVELLTKIAERMGGEDRARLLADLARAIVESETASGDVVKFHLSGYLRPPHPGHHPYPVEGKLLDRDGSELWLLLHADQNDHLLELEIIRWREGELQAPDWGSLSLF